MDRFKLGICRRKSKGDNKIMEKNTWKVLAIIFMILFILETAFVMWGVSIVNEEEEMKNRCYYEICEDYPEAFYYENTCECFDMNEETYEYELIKTEYMK